MVGLQMWSPLGPDFVFEPERSERQLDIDWDNAPTVMFDERTGIRNNAEVGLSAHGRALTTELDDSEEADLDFQVDQLGHVIPVMPFVRANGSFGLMQITMRGLGLTARDLQRSGSPGFSTTDDENTDDWSDSNTNDSIGIEIPWNEELLTKRGSDHPSLFRVVHTHDFSTKELVRPRGLYNTRNMCFFNSVLQVLVHTSPLYALVDDIVRNVPMRVSAGSSTGSHPGSNTGSGVTPVLDGMSRFFYLYSQYGDSRRAISGEDFYNVICSQPRFHVERDRQEDAQEFMSDLLDSLETTFRDAPPTTDDVRDNLLDAKRQALARTEQENQMNNDDDDNDNWTQVGANNRKVETQHAGRQDRENPIEELFGGRFRSTLIKQGKSSVTMEPFQQIMLDISEPGVNSVQKAFENLLQEEHLTIDSTRATKKSELDRVPPILIIHIKRFTFIQQNGEYEMGKITKPVVVDELLKLNCVGKGPVSYRPVGVIYHHGMSATRGHYTADVNVNNQWYKIDDEQVVPVDKNEVVGSDPISGTGSRSAYMLFYEKV